VSGAPGSPETPAGTRTIFTVGHSTRSEPELLELLHGAGVTQLIDVRAFAGSRRHPQFARAALARWLAAAGVDYMHMPQLGGRRRLDPSCPAGSGWKEPSFHAYAQYMTSAEFTAALELLERLAARSPLAVMCAEALWWRCHRRLIADALSARGWQVVHLGAGAGAAAHRLPPFAVVEGSAVTYPSPQQPLL
jgi:uncharacterized protein (DUF488 family)